jgi:hypothetical protein
VQRQGLPGVEAEEPLAAVPVAREDHRVALGDMQAAVVVQPRVDGQLVPVQAARDRRGEGRGPGGARAHEEQRAQEPRPERGLFPGH